MSALDTTVDGTGAARSQSIAVAGTEAGNSIVFEDVTVAYRRTVVLERLSLAVEPGEILALIGPSGSGKTTALRAVAGFVQPQSGRIRIGDIDVTDLPPYARGIGMVVQNYALFPHMRVEENVAFGLEAQKAPRHLIAERVATSLRMVGMETFKGRYPRELSGGQQQRVAIARALAIRPRVLLLDEPLSALDAQIRRNMVEELARLHRDLPTLTVLYVTHDQLEALTLADRIAIMRDGKLAAHGSSGELFRRPPNRFTAEFLGRANVLPVKIEAVERAQGLAQVRFGAHLFAVEAHPLLDAGETCWLCIRPHDLVVAGQGHETNRLEAQVESVQWQGDSHSIVLVANGETMRMTSLAMREPPSRGSTIAVVFEPDRASLIPEDGHAR